MSPQLLYSTSLPRWSRCSRQYITRFLDRGWGECLDDAPVKNKLSLSSLLPGALYSATHQCQLQYGSGSRLCDDMDNVCSTLWCSVGTTCHSKLDGAVDGTSCGLDKWCFGGDCVTFGFHPESVSGSWASWSEWSTCSRTCGVGVESAQRECDNPVPKYGGKYCLGERRRYKICNVAPCPHDMPTFRDVQCRHFNAIPYKGKFYKWEAVISKVSPCELHCRPLNEHFSEKMLDAVTDGTPCYEGNKSRDMCINGICKNIGCDYMIDSNAVEDRCGVCHGNGSTCTTVKKTFEESEGLGYVDIGLIPEGAWDIRIEEVAEAGNFLALRSDNPSTYFLNGGWTIQWNGDYKAAGTVFTYMRTGHRENLTSPGPTMEPLWIQLLFQETNPGVRFEYTISRNVSQDNNIPLSVFSWKYGSWTECSVTCGTGVQRQTVYCVEKTMGILEEHLCDPATRPDDNQTSCNKDPCPAMWWVGEWQKCSVSCGSSGLTKRTVLCIQAVSVEEQEALQPSECDHIPKPESLLSCNTDVPCPADWTTGSWSKCSLTCGSGVRRRNVTCSGNTDSDCDPQKKPLIVSTCFMQDCPQVVDNFGAMDWSGSGWPSKEVLNEINSIPEAKPPSKYSPTRAQPRSHSNHNNIIEGDFHYHNNLENGKQHSVQVDDFYYDYNFINFHEDLSDDFGSNEEDSGDSHRFHSPQEDSPSHDMNQSVPTATPTTISTISKAVFHMVNTEVPHINTPDNVKHSRHTAITNPEETNDFLSEDDLLPVSATHSPPLSTTPEQRYDTENISTMPHLEITTKEPTQDVAWGQYTEESENNYDNLSEEENDSEDVGVTPKQALPRHQTTVNTVVASTVRAHEAETYDDYEYGYIDESADQENVGTPTPETIIQVMTQEIPQTTTQSTLFPTSFSPEELDLDQLNLDQLDLDQPQFNAAYDTSKDNPGDLDFDLGTTPLPAAQKPTHLPFPSLVISGNQEASTDSTSLTTGIRPLPNSEGASWPSPDDFLPATTVQLPTLTSFPETTGTDFAYQDPLFDLADFDYNEIVVPPMMRSSSDSDPDASSAPIQRHTTPAQLMKSPTPAVLLMPTRTPNHTLAAPTSAQTSASTRVTAAAYWVAGNWSTCSTSCGLGAIWRTLACSTGSDPDCDPDKRPAPALRCYIRPCSTWKVGEWTQCSENCEGGMKSREVQCVDMRDQRSLRPFHCQAVSSRPQTQIPCNLQSCLHWYTSSWGPCSEVCGGGEQQRIVTCPENERCSSSLEPSNIQACNSQPCAQWLTGSWGQCSASCGGGVQHRLIKCVNTQADTDEEVDHSRCDHEPKPESSQKCNLQECDSNPSGAVCLRDHLTSRFCQTLRLLGRCHLANVQAQCCKTCSQRSRHPGSTSRH